MKTIIPYFALASALATTSADYVTEKPQLESVPIEGIVRVGESLPGFDGRRVNIMSTRAEVDAEYGDPIRCQSLPYFRAPRGIDGICTYDVPDSNNDLVLRYFADESRGQATGGPDDIFLDARWFGTDLDWVTEEGVSCASALEDPESAAEAYPNARVTRRRNGTVSRVHDRDLGFSIRVIKDTERGRSFCEVMIMVPGARSSEVAFD